MVYSSFRHNGAYPYPRFSETRPGGYSRVERGHPHRRPDKGAVAHGCVPQRGGVERSNSYIEGTV